MIEINPTYVRYFSVGLIAIIYFLKTVDPNLPTPNSFRPGEDSIAVGRVQGAEFLNFRTCPSTRCAVIQEIPKNTELRILEYKNGWNKVKYKSHIGYVSASFITNYSDKTPMTIRISNADQSLLLITGFGILFFLMFRIVNATLMISISEFGSKNIKGLAIGLSLLGVSSFIADPKTIYYASIAITIFVVLMVLMDSFFLSLHLGLKLDLILLRLNTGPLIIGGLKIISGIGLVYGVYQFIIGIGQFQWVNLGYSDFYSEMKKSGILFEEGSLNAGLNMIKALALNAANLIYLIVSNFFEPWATISASAVFLRR